MIQRERQPPRETGRSQQNKKAMINPPTTDRAEHNGLRALRGVALDRRIFRQAGVGRRPAPAAAPNLLSGGARADRAVRLDQARLRNGGHKFLEKVVRLRRDRSEGWSVAVFVLRHSACSNDDPSRSL